MPPTFEEKTAEALCMKTLGLTMTKTLIRASLIALLLALIVGLPILMHRASYAYRKRLRVVTPGKVYRSGQLTQDGFTDAVRRLNIRTIINLQNDYPDPDIPQTYFNQSTTKESELCKKLGVKYVQISPDLLPSYKVPGDRPRAIDEFLKVMRDTDNYPVLIHCRAGLHRTGCLVAVYRMAFEHWSVNSAFAEMKAHGFGRACTASNEYVRQYVLTFDPDYQRPTGKDAADLKDQ